MAVDVTVPGAQAALPGTRVVYHGSLVRHHGPAVVVESCGSSECDRPVECHEQAWVGQPRWVLRTDAGVEILHVSPRSFTRRTPTPDPGSAGPLRQDTPVLPSHASVDGRAPGPAIEDTREPAERPSVANHGPAAGPDAAARPGGDPTNGDHR